jgi:hypothetical protein
MLARTENAHSIPPKRRAWVRWPSDQGSVCRPVGGMRGVQWEGTIRNLSAGGAAIRLSRRFEIGTLLDIDVRDPAERVLATVSARVVHVSLQGTSRQPVFPAQLGDLSA